MFAFKTSYSTFFFPDQLPFLKKCYLFIFKCNKDEYFEWCNSKNKYNSKKMIPKKGTKVFLCEFTKK